MTTKKKTKATKRPTAKKVKASAVKPRWALKPPAKRLKSWSFSRYSDYKKCPLKAKLKHLDRIPEPGSEAMDRGTAIHKLAEDFIKGKLKKLPAELAKFKDTFLDLRDQYKKRRHSMVVEDTWAFTKDWDQTKWDDWVGCWVRIKMDCGRMLSPTTMRVIDWKTGKFREEAKEEYLEQLELYALSALLLHPQIESVTPSLAYLDIGFTYPPKNQEKAYTRADLPKLKAAWDKRTRKMLLDESFVPRPNDTCRWCHFRAANKDNGGGQCKY